MAEIKARKHGSVRNYQLKRRYGLTADEVAALRDGQGGFCLICLHRRSLHVDHDHSSGDLRGLLCFRCNGGLGQFKDDPRLMRQAVDYLEDRLLEPYQPQVGVSGSGVRGQRKSWRHYHLVQRYGIGSAEVECLVGLQGGVCPICRKASAAVVDHDHVSGAVRGILCPGCNTGMGQFRDNPWLLRRAIEYLSGGLLGLRAAGDGTYEVAVVRPRGSGPAVDPGWDAGRAATDDLALLHALAHGDSGDPWEDDVDVAPSGPCELRFPPLDLSEPDAGAPPPTGPPHPPGPPSPPECAFS